MNEKRSPQKLIKKLGSLLAAFPRLILENRGAKDTTKKFANLVAWPARPPVFTSNRDVSTRGNKSFLIKTGWLSNRTNINKTEQSQSLVMKRANI